MDISSILPLLIGGGDSKELLLKLLQQKMSGGNNNNNGGLGGLFSNLFGGGGQKEEVPKPEQPKENSSSVNASVSPVNDVDFPFEKTNLKPVNERSVPPSNMQSQKNIYDLLPKLLSIKR